MPNCSVKNLHHLKSDHRLVFVSLSPIQSRVNKPFRCLANWLLHDEFKGFVSSTWDNELDMCMSLEHFQKEV